YNATISACGKGLEWQLALMLFQDMGAAALPSDFFAYSAVLSAVTSAATGSEVHQLQDRLRGHLRKRIKNCRK
ncbi:unnamed protein product, partial [Cladocopium goreaui]